MLPAVVVDRLRARWLPELPVLSFQKAEFVARKLPAMVELVRPLAREIVGDVEAPPTRRSTAPDADFGERRHEDIRSLVFWLATLPESTLNSPSALSTALRKSPLRDFITLQRERYGAKQLRLTGWEDAKAREWRFYAPRHSDSYDALFRTAIYYAALPRIAHWAEMERRAEDAARSSADRSLLDLLAELGFADPASEPPSSGERLSPGRLAALTLLVAEEEARDNLGRSEWHDANPWNGVKSREASWLIEHGFVDDVENPYGGFPHYRTTPKGRAAYQAELSRRKRSPSR